MFKLSLPFQKYTIVTPLVVLGVCIFALTVFVFADEDKHTIHIFPTSVTGEGWMKEHQALEQTLGAGAKFSDFNRQNSAFLVLVEEKSKEEAQLEEGEDDVTYQRSWGNGDTQQTVSGTDSVSEIEQDSATLSPLFESEDFEEERSDNGVSRKDPNVEEVIVMQDISVLDFFRDVAMAVARSKVYAEEEDSVITDEARNTQSLSEQQTQGVIESDETALENNEDVLIDSAEDSESLEGNGGESVTESEPETNNGEVSEERASPGEGAQQTQEPESTPSSIREESDDVRICSVLGGECHSILFEGFDIGSVLSQHSIKGYTLRVSLAGKSIGEPFSPDVLLVRYFYRGKWRVAGQVTLDKEHANATNAGHFSFALPDLVSWDALKDLRVELELVRHSDVRTELFIDSVWVDAEYEGEGEGDAPKAKNILKELAITEDSGRPDVLFVDGERIELTKTDVDAIDDLVIRTDKDVYHGLSSSRMYVAVTNRGKRPENVRFTARIGVGADIVGVWEQVETFEEQATSRFGEIAYFCEGGWKLAGLEEVAPKISDETTVYENEGTPGEQIDSTDVVPVDVDEEGSEQPVLDFGSDEEVLVADQLLSGSSGEIDTTVESVVEEDESVTFSEDVFSLALSDTYTCKATNQTEVCSSFNADKTNCIVGNERLGVDTETLRTETWAPVSLRDIHPKQPRGGILAFFGFGDGKEDTTTDVLRRVRESVSSYKLQPLETRYFAVDIEYPVQYSGGVRLEFNGGKTQTQRTVEWQSAYTHRIPVTITRDTSSIGEEEGVPILEHVVIDSTHKDFFEGATLDGRDIRFYDVERKTEVPMRVLEYTYIDETARYGVEVGDEVGEKFSAYAYFGNIHVEATDRSQAPTLSKQPLRYVALEGEQKGSVFSFTSHISHNALFLPLSETSTPLIPRVSRDLFVEARSGDVLALGPFSMALAQTEQVTRFENPTLTFFPDSEVRETQLLDGRVQYEIARYHLRDNEVLFGDIEVLPAPTPLTPTEEENRLHFLRTLQPPQFHEFKEELRDFRLGEAPVFTLGYKTQKGVLERTMRGLFRDKLDEVRGVTLRRGSVPVPEATFDITYGAEDEWTIRLTSSPRSIVPGVYTLEVTVDEAGTLYTDSFEFYWGVLAMNTNKSVYELGEEAYLTFAALSDDGNTLCDADLALTVRTPSGEHVPVPVTPSGACLGNNVTTIPDYSALFTPTELGEHAVLLMQYDHTGAIWRAITDSFFVEEVTPYSIARTGPTRIYPVASYDMTLTVESREGFSGEVVETIPRDFIVVEHGGAVVRDSGEAKELVWEVAIGAGDEAELTYRFDAPDVSPYLYLLGEAKLETEGETVFVERRKWQVASDAVGYMLILWDGASDPTGWECVSCNPGEPFHQRFIRGAEEYGGAGGATTHTHTASALVGAPSAVAATTPGGTTVSGAGHTHTYTPAPSYESNMPEHRQLKVLRSVSAGTPSVLPAGAIVFFLNTPPTGWTRYSVQDGRYIYGENTAGATGGANTHSHILATLTGAASGDTYGTANGGTRVSVASANHTHTVSGNTDTESIEPPYIEVVLGKLDNNNAPPIGMVAMWNEDLPSGWAHRSETGQPFHGNFVKPASTYGSTGGSLSHTHASQSITSGASNQTVMARASGNVTSGAHTHTINITYSPATHLPPYREVVFAEFMGADATFTQDAFRFYQNSNNQTPADPWTSGGVDLLENEVIDESAVRIKSGDVVRLRMSLLVGNASTSAGDVAFTLEYGSASTTCSAVTAWHKVGDTASSSAWRGYNNASVSDGSTLSSLLLASSTVEGTYEEENDTGYIPNGADVGDYIEWDWVLQQNNALGGTTYCFRMVENDGTPLTFYTHYPSVYTDETPSTPIQYYPFDNEKTASTTAFDFVSTDGEGQDIHYQIQVATDPAFTSTIFDHTSVSETEYFKNLVIPSDKSPFNSGQGVRYTPPSNLSEGTTYWWRVRARDTTGSLVWGEWATSTSVTVDSSVQVDTWFQTTDEQFERGVLSGVEAGAGGVSLLTTPGSGTLYSPKIDFSVARTGTIWGDFSWADTTPVNSNITYQVEYYTSTSSWALIPNSDLSGNSTGFGTSPISLGGLDTETYASIRLKANFTSTGGDPTLADWTVTWSTRVDTPTLFAPFDNEKIPTITPSFTFKTDDPQEDALTYQIEWSTDATFTTATTRTSDTHIGFENTTTPLDTDPFNSGDTIRFTVQSSDALTDGTTYYWRVRAKDTGGADAYSLWSQPYSFTVDTTVEVSTWFQTTGAQFTTNILSGTVVLGGGVTVATTTGNALIVYGEGTETSPRYRLWNGAVWGTEGQALNVGAPINWVVTRAGTTRDEYVLGTLGTNANVRVQVYSEGVWGNQTTLTASISNTNKRGFDIVYESISGRAMAVTCDGDSNPSYYLWNGTSWSSAGTITTATANNCEWVRLASDPTSDEIIMVTLPIGGGQYEAQVWNGTTWGNSVTWGGMTEANEGIGVAYQSSGGLAVVTVNNDGASPPNRMLSRTWNGSVWSGTTNPNVGYFEHGMLRADPASNAMELCFVDDATNVETIPWNGTAWGTLAQLDATAHAKNSRPVDCAFGTTTNQIISAYSDATTARYQTWNGTAWSGEQSISGIGRSAVVQLTRTGDGKILGLFFDHVNGRYDFSYWNGGLWSSVQTLESVASVTSAPYKEPFMVAPQNPLTSGKMYSSPIVFSKGAGQKWDKVSWNDLHTANSNVLYQVQYYTSTSSWALIPDADLSGNSTGITTSPINISGLSTQTYGTLRIVANFSCDGATCPTLNDWTVEWSAGATISGTIQEVNQTTNVTTGEVAVAVNNVLQTGRVGTISNGTWSIANVPMMEGDIVTVFVNGAAQDTDRAVAVFAYGGLGDVSGIELYEEHLVLGSGEAQTLTNADIAGYDYSFSTNNDLLFDVDANNDLIVCSVGSCISERLFIRENTTYRPDSTSSGNITTHDIEIKGVLVADGNIITVSGSWINSGTFTANTSSVVFSALTGTESINSTGASIASFNAVTFGLGTGSAVWELGSSFTALSGTTLSYGTLSPGPNTVFLGGNLTIGASGVWQKGTATTTFNGSTLALLTDSTASKQDLGKVSITGANKTVRLNSGAIVTDIAIAINNTFDVSANNYPLEIRGELFNEGTFISRQGTITLTATSAGKEITPGNSSFYNLTVNGVGGGWYFGQSNVTITNNLTIATGTLSLAVGTTTISGNIANSGGVFLHNNGTVLLVGSGNKTLYQNGSPFLNLTTNGSGSWSWIDSNATSSGSVRLTQGTLLFPSGIYAIGRSLVNNGGTISAPSGTLRFYSGGSETIRTNSSPLHSLTFDGVGGTFSMADTNATASGTVRFINGTASLPSGVFSVGGSFLTTTGAWQNNNGTVRFSAVTTGNTVSTGVHPFYHVQFDSPSGGWTVEGNATSTGNWALYAGTDFTLQSGSTLAVGSIFSNDMPESTTWTGSTLSLYSGTSYFVGDSSFAEEVYGTLSIGANTHVRMWQSSASSYILASTGSLYSQNHADVMGVLNIYGSYSKLDGIDYWSYETDFDGTDISETPRQVTVRFADNAKAEYLNTALEILGASIATTTISNQGSGSYSLSITEGTLNASHYAFTNLGTQGLELSGSTTVTSINDGTFTLTQNGGSMLTVSSTTVNHNPALQPLRIGFSTSTEVSAGHNVTLSGMPTSYWWFRDHYGNYHGEAFDNDPGGDPGYIRWDDSGFSISISGTAYLGEGTGVASLCNGSVENIRLVVGGVTHYTTSCNATTGAFTFPSVSFSGDVPLIVYFDSNGGARGATVSRTPQGNISDFDIYQNRVIVRHEDSSPISISHMASYDSSNDIDIPFDAEAGTVTVAPDTTLLVWKQKTFAPNGNVTLAGGGSGESYDGTLRLSASSTFTALGSEMHSVGGSWISDESATFNAGNSTVAFIASTLENTIAPASPFHNTVFSGVNGGWKLASSTVVNNNLTVSNGTLTGDTDLTVLDGAFTGNGIVSMNGGTVTIGAGGSFGGSGTWTFNNLVFGDGGVNVTSKVGSGTTIVNGVLTVLTNHTLEAGSSDWKFSNTGTVLDVQGLFSAQLSSTTFNGTSAMNIPALTYYNLVLAPSGAGYPTYTMDTGTVQAHTITIGDGTHFVTVDANENDPLISTSGTVRIHANATLSASNSNDLRIGGSYVNEGTFSANGGGVVFNSLSTGNTVQSGHSPFHHLTFNSATGGWTVFSNATTTGNCALTDASSFTLASGSTLEVQGAFTNAVGGMRTDWTEATLFLNSGTNFSINAKEVDGDVYNGVLRLGNNTHIRAWNSSAGTYALAPTASLYSQDHGGNRGELFIWGAYGRLSGFDYWSYATDFDGENLEGGNERPVSVRIAENASVTLSGGALQILGTSTATTTVQNQGSGTYGIAVTGGTFSAQYYALRNMNTSGLSFSGTPNVTALSDGDFELAENAGTLMTVAGSVISANPLRTSYRNRFATSTGALTGTSVTTSGTTLSAWRFTEHYGGLDGEAYDNDNGDPGYIIWDDSDALINLSGIVYGTDESSISSVCDGVTPVVRFMKNNLEYGSTTCAVGTGVYQFTSIVYNVGDVFTVYLNTNGGEKATTVTVDPVITISDMHLFEDRLVVRHEESDPITIADLTLFDSDNDSDVLFNAEIGSPSTLTLDAGSKLIVWGTKTFAPEGDVTVSALGSGSSYDGDLELGDGAVFSATGVESHTIGGSFIAGAGASLTPGNSTFTFTATSTGKTVGSNTSSFGNITFDGVGGGWTFTEAHATTTGDFVITNGSVTLSANSLAVGGSFINDSIFIGTTTIFNFYGSGSKQVKFRGYDVGPLIFARTGSLTLIDTNATTTGSVVVRSGTVTLPSGRLAVRTDFETTGGSFGAGNGTVEFYGDEIAKTITGLGSSFGTIVISGTGSWSFGDDYATTTGSVLIEQGALTAPPEILSVGQSLISNSIFNANAGTLNFFATSTGYAVNPNGAVLGSVYFNGLGGGWIVTANATSTGNWNILSGASYTMATGTVLEVQGEFKNLLGGAATNWTDSTLYLNASGTSYVVNTKSAGGDAYAYLTLGPNTDVRMWDSSGATTTVHASSSLYSMDHGGSAGALNIYGEYHRVSGSDYWSYATDFDGSALGGNSRPVIVSIAPNSTLSYSGGALSVKGTASDITSIGSIGSGTYGWSISGGAFDAEHWRVRSLNAEGLTISGSTNIGSLNYADFELNTNGGALLTVHSSVIDQNPTKFISGARFATGTGVTSGYNVRRTGDTTNFWYFQNHSGGFDGEVYDDDGLEACGAIRWSDSLCLEVSQSAYRFRADDGGGGAPDSEWFDPDWEKRVRVNVSNTNGTALTNAVVRFDLPHQIDMSTNFVDIRFTDASGTTSIPFTIENFVTSATATVWVKVPYMEPNSVTPIYAYYDNILAVSADSGKDTFIYFDDFEDGNISEYSGDTTYFTANTSFNKQGSYGLSARAGYTEEQTADGIYRTATSTPRGSTIHWYQYVDATKDDESCTLFAVQNPGSDNKNYAVCLDQYPSEKVVIAKDVSSNDGSGTELASSVVTYATGWYEVEVDWLVDGTIDVSVHSSSGALLTNVSASDSTYTTGGIGFSFWYQSGGWDYYTTRPYVPSMPQTTVGLPQERGGASWLGAQNTPVSHAQGETFRVRFAIENSGLEMTGQQYRLQVADRAEYGTCNAVPSVSFDDVPNEAGCGTSPVCMTTTSQYFDGDPTQQALTTRSNFMFTEGKLIESPSNQTPAMTLPQTSLTEVEYAIEITPHATSDSYCLRTTSGGLELDTYQQVAEITAKYEPQVTNWTLNGGNPSAGVNKIYLVEGGTQTVYATGTVTDLNGWEDILYATSTIYRSGVGSYCTEDPNNCYHLNSLHCPFQNCSGSSCEVVCSFEMEFYAEPTDQFSTHAAEHWEATLFVTDSIGDSATAVSNTSEVMTLAALSLVSGNISYIDLGLGEDSGSINATSTLRNTGNKEISIDVEGTDMTDGTSSIIPVSNQKFATSGFTYSACLICEALSGSASYVGLDLPKPTSAAPVTNDLYWGVYVPSTGVSGTEHYGQNTFYAR